MAVLGSNNSCILKAVSKRQPAFGQTENQNVIHCAVYETGSLFSPVLICMTYEFQHFKVLLFVRQTRLHGKIWLL